MTRLIVLSLLICLTTLSGCRVCCWGKRASEKRCPTDIRKTHFWCFGEDALFDYPCGPSGGFHGHKPTCWREWPAPGTEWRDIYCGPVIEGATIQEYVPPAPTVDSDLPTPAAKPAVPLDTPPTPSGVAPATPIVPPTSQPDNGQGFELFPAEPATDPLPTEPVIPPQSGALNESAPRVRYQQTNFSSRFPAQRTVMPTPSGPVQESSDDQTGAALRHYMSEGTE